MRFLKQILYSLKNGGETTPLVFIIQKERSLLPSVETSQSQGSNEAVRKEGVCCFVLPRHTQYMQASRDRIYLLWFLSDHACDMYDPAK